MKKSEIIKKITLAGVLLGIILLMQGLKNISGYIAGPAINAALVIAALEVNLWCGIAFSLATPALSLLLAPASATTTMAYATFGIITIIIMLGNIIYVLSAYMFRNKKPIYFVISLIFGVVAKWGFMWGFATLTAQFFTIQSQVLTKVFAIMQIATGAISIPIVFAVKLAVDKLRHRKAN